MSLEDDLDTLYGVAPEEFTALRKELATAAKKRGDGDAAKVISASRRPTAAAWVVNVLIRADPTAKTRLGELTAQLQAAHASMDGARIRELTGAQRKLIAELVRAAFTAADLANPSAALREDITGTLQAAIADPAVADRLGRLEKAEQFSGFGDFGGVSESAPVKPAPKKQAPKVQIGKPEPDEQPKASAGEVRAARKRRDNAAKAESAAQKTAADAAQAVADARTAAATALRRYEKLLADLSAAEHEMNSATADVESAEQAASKAAQAVAAAVAELAEAEGALADLGD